MASEWHSTRGTDQPGAPPLTMSPGLGPPCLTEQTVSSGNPPHPPWWSLQLGGLLQGQSPQMGLLGLVGLSQVPAGQPQPGSRLQAGASQ